MSKSYDPQVLLPRSALNTVRQNFIQQFNSDIRETEQIPRTLKGIPKDIEENIIPILTSDKNIGSNFLFILGTITLLQSQFVKDVFQKPELQNDRLLEFARSDLQGYQIIKYTISQNNYLEQDIIKNMIEIIDNLSDYDNSIFGILINKPQQLENALEQIDFDDFQKTLSGTILVFVFILAIALIKEYNKEHVMRMLKLGIKYSERIESYVDTIDVLTNPEELEALKGPE